MTRTARTKYSLKGFRLLSTIKDDGLISYPANNVSIEAGDILVDNGSGFATNASITAFTNLFLGVAAADCDNSAGTAGDLDVKIIPPRPGYKFMVKNESATVAAATDRGETCDLESEDGIDVTDNAVNTWGFMVEEIDISTAALAANTGGFCIGRFVLEGDQA